MNYCLDFSDIKVGKQYLYEEGHYLAILVTILEDTSNREHYNFKLRVDDWIGGLCKPLEEGYKFGVSRVRDKSGYYMLDMTFKEVGKVPEYALRFGWM